MRKQINKGDSSEHVNASPTSLAFNGPAIDLLAGIGGAWMRSCVEWQREIARFAKSRVEQDMDFARLLTQCRSVTDLANLQQKWAAALARDYSEESNRLMQFAAQAAGEGARGQKSAAQTSGSAGV